MNRLKLVSLLFVLALFCAAGAAGAAGYATADGFTGAAGYEPVDADSLEEALAGMLPASDSVFTMSGQLSPVAKAVLALEASEGALDQARYHLQVWVHGGSGDLFVQLDRYSLAEQPDVSWRLVTSRLQGNEAVIQAAARQELSGEAEGCFGTDCRAPEPLALQLQPTADPVEFWPAAQMPYAAAVGGLPTPAFMFDALAEMAELVTYDHEAAVNDDSVLIAEAVVEYLPGDEARVEGALRSGALMDDSVAAVWSRLIAAGGWEPGLSLTGAVTYECHDGASDDGRCM